MATKRILTGIRPTGPLHLGHYIGALKQWLELQDEYECFFLIADVQALTTHFDNPRLIEESVREVMLDWISVGLDPEKPNVYFVLQSAVPELTELTAYLLMLISLAKLQHNPTIRAELRDKEIKNPSAGFVTYPVSQAADILLFTPYPRSNGDELLVPVGEDQIPHLDDTNYLARNFNEYYGETLLPCTPKVGDVGRLPGIDDNPDKKAKKADEKIEDGAEEKRPQKMGKGAGNALFLKDDSERVRSLVAKMYTDKTKEHKGDPGHPDQCPVYTYHYAFCDDLALLRIRDLRCKMGQLGCVDCKKDLAELLNNFLDPFRARRKIAEAQAPLDDYLARGIEKAREVGQKTMSAVRTAMYLDYPLIFNR